MFAPGTGICIATMQCFDPTIRVQDPPEGMFSSTDLEWTANDMAYIHWSRRDNFVDGEGRRDILNETSFYIKNSDHKPTPGCSWLEKATYWCGFGPRDIPSREDELPPNKVDFPAAGRGSRPGACKQLFNNHKWRGCRSHFYIRRFKNAPEVIAIFYPDRCILKLKLVFRVHCNIVYYPIYFMLADAFDPSSCLYQK